MNNNLRGALFKSCKYTITHRLILFASIALPIGKSEFLNIQKRAHAGNDYPVTSPPPPPGTFFSNF